MSLVLSKDNTGQEEATPGMASPKQAVTIGTTVLFSPESESGARQGDPMAGESLSHTPERNQLSN